MGVLSAFFVVGHHHTTAVWQDAMREPASPAVRPHTRINLYGNPVSTALADYGIDPRGNLYERHDPDTALLKLGPPGT